MFRALCRKRPEIMSLTTNDFDFDLPQELIAQRPLAQRDQSRLMVLHRDSGATEHRTFADLPGLLRPGDVLVLNDTRVIPAKFFCRRASGGRIEGLFLGEADVGVWDVMLKNAGRCKIGESLTAEGADDVALELLANCGQGRWSVRVHPDAQGEPDPIGDANHSVGVRKGQVEGSLDGRVPAVLGSRARAFADLSAGHL